MRLGINEKIVLAIIKEFPKIEEKQLGRSFFLVSKRKGRIDSITHSLRIKGLIKGTKNFSIVEGALKNIDLPKILVNKDRIKDLNHFDGLKLGSLGKSIIYMLGKTEKSSLQFLSVFFQKPTKNIYAITQRLEEKNIVISYNSRIRRLNLAGKRYYPKYYVLTDVGKFWLEINLSQINNKDEIDLLLKEPEERIQAINLKL